MAVIGSFGPIIFEVTNEKTLTYEGFTRTTEPRFIEHKVRGFKPRLEFEGAGIDPIKFSIRLRAEFGINPEEQMAKIREFARKGHKDLFIRGNSPISTNYWVIKRAEETHKRIDNMGYVLEIEAQIELLEYENEKVDTSKKTVSSTNNSSKSNSSTKPIGKMKITVKSVHIRSGPSVNNSVLGYAMNGDELTVYGIENGWYKLGGGKYITANSAYSTFKGAS